MTMTNDKAPPKTPDFAELLALYRAVAATHDADNVTAYMAAFNAYLDAHPALNRRQLMDQLAMAAS